MSTKKVNDEKKVFKDSSLVMSTKKANDENKAFKDSSLVIYTRNILTSIFVLGLLILCENPIISLISMILVPFTLIRILGRCRTTKGRIVATLMLIMFLLISIFFFRVQEEPKTEDYKEPEMVTQGEVEQEENANPEENKEEAPKVEEQKVSKKNEKTKNKKYKAPLNNPDVLATYTGFPGNNPYVAPTGGSATVQGSDFTEIIAPDNSSLDKEIEDKKNKGHDVKQQQDGVTSTVDRIPRPEKPKDETTRVDLDKEKEENPEKEVTSSTEEPKIPDPLPDDEQIKQDAENVNDDDLADLVNKVPAETPSQKPQDQKPAEQIPAEKVPDKQEPQEQKPEEKNPEEQKPMEKPTQKDEVVNPPKNDSDSEEAKPSEVVKTPVSISASSTSINAGESVQFNVTGDVQSIDGLDGLNSSRGEGFIVVNTEPGVATIITVVVTGTDGSSATASVTVNV